MVNITISHYFKNIKYYIIQVRQKFYCQYLPMYDFRHK